MTPFSAITLNSDVGLCVSVAPESLHAASVMAARAAAARTENVRRISGPPKVQTTLPGRIGCGARSAQLRAPVVMGPWP